MKLKGIVKMDKLAIPSIKVTEQLQGSEVLYSVFVVAINNIWDGFLSPLLLKK